MGFVLDIRQNNDFKTHAPYAISLKQTDAEINVIVRKILWSDTTIIYPKILASSVHNSTANLLIYYISYSYLILAY